MYGVKGIPVPAGAENVAEQIGSRLVQRGHQVTAYVRSHYTPRTLKEYKGIRLVHLPSIPTKNLDAITHSFFATWAVLLSDVDVVHIHSIGNSVFAWLPRLRGMKTVVQSHGLDWQRAKWGRFAHAYLRFSDYTAVHFPHATTVVSRKMQNYYQGKFHKPVMYIPNGVIPGPKVEPREIHRYGLKGDDYILFAARLVPEKGCHILIQAFQSLGETAKKLVVAGDGNYRDSYVDQLKQNANEMILFPGFVQGRLLDELLSNAYLYVLPSDVEGLSTGLLEAMGFGNCVLVSDIQENLEAVGEAGLSFRTGSCEDLRSKLAALLEDPSRVQRYRGLAKKAALEKYDWERVTDQYENLYQSLLMGKAGPSSL